MIFPFLLKKLFSKSFQVLLLLMMIGSLTLFFRFPNLFYDNLITSISDLLKTKYGTGGSVEKIDAGLNKLALLIIVLSLALFIYLQFWKWLFNQLKGTNTFFIFPNNIYIEKRDWYVMIGFMIAGVLLRIFSLNQSLWQDEIGVYNTFMQQGIFSTIVPKNSMGSHPLMQIIVTIFTNIVGVNEFTLRFPIFFIAVISIPLIYFVCFKITGQRMIATIAAVFLTIHSYHIYYSFQMRGYAILVFLCILSTYLCIKLLSEGSKRIKILFVITNICIVYTHLYSIYFVISQQLVIAIISLYQKYMNKNASICFAKNNVIAYFYSFIISMLFVLLLYFPQLPVICMNILDTTKDEQEFSIISYFYGVVVSSNFVIAYSSHILICYLYAVIICLLFLLFVKKNSAYQFVFFTGIILFITTALIPSGSGFFARYLICEVPLFIIISAIVLNNLWLSVKKLHKSFAIVLTIFYLTITVISFPKVYRTIQNYKGAVEYIHSNRKSANTIIVSNSLGKEAVTFYDKKIIPLFSIQQFDSLMRLHSEIYAITTLEEFAGKGLFINDKECQIKIRNEFKHINTFDGEIPVNVWYHE